MIKDILVNLAVGEKAGPAGDYAISVAAACDAHLAGLAFRYDPVVPISGAGYVPAEVIQMQESRQRKSDQNRARPLHGRKPARRRQWRSR